MIKTKKLMIGILIMMIIGYLFSSCEAGHQIKYSEELNYYVDTINGHVILTTVLCNKYNGNVSVSISSLELTEYDYD